MAIFCDNILTTNMEIKKKKKACSDDIFQKNKKPIETVWLNKPKSL